LIATAHGKTMENIMFNPTISDLVGGITSVTLSDEEAIRRGTQKSILERTSAPTFDVLVEIHSYNEYAIYLNVAKTVDKYLRGFPVSPEIRRQKKSGEFEIINPQKQERDLIDKQNSIEDEKLLVEMEKNPISKIENKSTEEKPPLRIYPFGISSNYLKRAIQNGQISLSISQHLPDSDLVITTDSYKRKNSRALQKAEEMGIAVHSIHGNTLNDIKRFIRNLKTDIIRNPGVTENQLESIIQQVFYTELPVNLPPAGAKMRIIEHQLAERFGLHSESFGEEPHRFVVVYPPGSKEVI
jgi:hypothetical protein